MAKKEYPFFVIPNTFGDGPNALTSSDISDRSKDHDFSNSLIEEVHEYCVREKYLLLDERTKGNFVPNIQDENKLLQRTIYEFNFRDLCHPETIDELERILKDTDSNMEVSRLQDFAVMLLTYNDSDFMNRLVGKLYASLSSLDPHRKVRDAQATYKGDIPEAERVLSWEEVHERIPYLWLLHAVQTVLRSYIV